MTLRVAAGVLIGLILTPAASGQVVPALAPGGGAGAAAGAAASAGSNTSTAAAGAGTDAGNNGTTRPSGVPDRFPPSLPTLSPQLPLAARERRNVAMATRWRNRPARPHIGPDGVLHFTQGDGEPTVVCAPYKVCDIALEAGENPTDLPDIGDPRWITHPRISGTGAGRTIHVIVKPSDAGLDSNIVLQTDKRTVAIRLVSRAYDYMPFVKLDDPDGAGSEANTSWASVVSGDATGRLGSAAAASPCDTAPMVPPDAYKISGDAVAWRPTQAFAVSTPVGIKTCIEFRADIASIDVPALVALDSSGGEQVVSYRQQGRRFLVDRLIDRAELVAGVGGSQDRVTIQRRGYR